MYGLGLLKGLGVSLKRFWMPKITEKYPEVQPNLPERSKGSFKYNKETCTSCELCSMACPNGVIKVEWHKDENNRKKLDRYRMNLGHCLFCGLCVEACPNGSIDFKTDFALGCWRKEDIYRVWTKSYPESETVSAPAPVGAAPAGQPGGTGEGGN
ncbi:MAG TPA: 4Fe-4S binding protein [Rectinemataceae bacterium]|nr:4Fe-4S binding protein [Rectinemataceae bacterium]